ncbi:MAG: calcium-binding protein [Bdellovibrionales bacterium]
MNTNGNDFISFNDGTIQVVTTTLTNPYSSKSILIDDEYNVNSSVYDGLGGMDFFSMTSLGDFITITNDVGVQLIKNIEFFIAGNGGDVINLADADIEYGDVTILGGAGDDILWSNNGNDFIDGAPGNDIIDGGGGDDDLMGGSGNDQIFGGIGNDMITGGEGDDILFGGSDLGLRDLDKEFLDNISFPDLVEGTNIVDLVPPGTSSLGINGDNLSVNYEATAELTFLKGRAGYKNTLAIYEVANNGDIQNIDVLWANVKDAGFDNITTIDIPTGSDGGEFGFFIIANGFRVNDSYNGLDIEGDNNVSIIYDYGGANERIGNINDDGDMLSTVYNDGVTEVVLSGPTYHTTPRDGDNSINPDNKTHVVSGQASDGVTDVLRIGFEDLPNLGDADFEDVLFDLNINEIRVDASETGSDTIIGGAGNDSLYGEGGDDILIVGDGLDQIFGGSGSDIIRFDVADNLVDVIHGFDVGAGGDVIDLSLVLDFGDDLSDVITDFVQLVQNGNDTEIQINAAGDGTGFAAMAIIEGGVSDSLSDLVSNGNLIA